MNILFNAWGGAAVQPLRSRVTNHTKTKGSFTVVSRDSQYEYTGIEHHDFLIIVQPLFCSAKKLG